MFFLCRNLKTVLQIEIDTKNEGEITRILLQGDPLPWLCIVSDGMAFQFTRDWLFSNCSKRDIISFRLESKTVRNISRECRRNYEL